MKQYTITVRYSLDGDPHTVQYTPLAATIREARATARERFTATHPGVDIVSMRTQWKTQDRTVQTQHAVAVH